MKNNVKDKFKKQKKNRKTLKKELTEGEWMADSIAIAHVELNVFQIIFLKQNFVLFPIFATTNSYACRVLSILIKYGHISGADPRFFLEGGARLLLYFNTNKPHSFFFAEYQLY